ncbi:MAG TPA: NADP-dependent oxidoreductase [Sphaerochaeta sp.]|nr:NADP-dependent oxidoreductase [Sphaerochaeta sp.]
MKETMQAFVRTSSQTLDIQLATVTIPEITPDEVLVEVKAFGVGLQERYFIPSDAAFPYVVGTEASGVIRAVGENIETYAIGERVILTSVLQPKGGCWAEYVAVPHTALMALPATMSFVEGAALPVVSKTALECMRELNLQAGSTLFVAGASGAIGTLVIQLAVANGIRVIGSASEKNHQYLLDLGSEHAVDYTDPAWPSLVKSWWPDGADAALAIQPGTVRQSMQVVRDGSVVITVSGDDQIPGERSITVRQMQHQIDTQPAVLSLVSDIAQGKIRLVLEEIYPFKKALDALRKTETRHARGKVVVSLEEGNT